MVIVVMTHNGHVDGDGDDNDCDGDDHGNDNDNCHNDGDELTTIMKNSDKIIEIF